MRLICPNCDAQYEIDDHAIPIEGRDVQCSACGHTWYQRHPDADPPEEAPAAAPSADWRDEEEPWSDPAEPWEEAGAPDADKLASALGAGRAGDAENWAEDGAEDGAEDDAGGGAQAGPEPRRQGLNEDVAAILREEAEREARARRGEAGALESQGELGLGAAALQGRTGGRNAGFSDPFGDVEDAAQPRRRNTSLPDIDEINSSLNPPEAPEPDEEEDFQQAAKAERNGFRRGFALTLLVGAIGLAVYAFTPQIVERAPMLAGPLGRYVAAIDAGRVWLDDTMKDIIASIESGG